MPEKGTNKGELPPEVDKYLAALIKDPKSKAFVPLADAYRKAGMLDEAIKVAQDGLKHNPNYTSGRFILGRCYFEKVMLKEADEEISKVVKVNPENTDAQRILAKIKEKTGRPDEAIRIWDIVLTLLPNDDEARQRISELKAALPHEEERKPEPVTQIEEKKESYAQVEKKVEEAEKPEPGKQQESVLPSGTESTVQSVDTEGKATITEETVSKTEACEIPVTETERGTTEGEKDSIPSAEQEIPAAVYSEISVREEPEKTDAVVNEQILEAGEKESAREISQEEKRGVEGEGISTRALAELYVKQGFLERALKVYKELESTSPDDKWIKEQINFINTELSKKKEKDSQDVKLKDNIKTLSSWLEKIKRGG